MEALQALPKGTEHGVSPYRLLLLGSGCSRLRHYLHHMLQPWLSEDLRLAAVVPRKALGQAVGLARWPPDSGLHAPDGGYSLVEALRVFKPSLVICSCMPPGEVNL